MTVAPYGTWHSPIQAKHLAENAISNDDILVDSATSTLYHIETRAGEGGRNVVVRSKDGVDVHPPAWNARTRVQEYGGASAVIRNNKLIFSNFTDGQIYIQGLAVKDEPKKVTSNPTHRFADFAIHPLHPHFIVCVLEDHTNDLPSKVLTSLIIVDTREDTCGQTQVLLSGSDFYSNPRFSEDGNLLAWCQWNHPDMPWDGSQVYVAGIEATADQVALAPRLLPIVRLGGEPGKVSAVQPTWIGPRSLVFSCDMTGYQNPWISELDESLTDKSFQLNTRPLFSAPINQDFVDPSWWLGTSNFVPLDDTSLLFSISRDARHVLCIVGLDGSVKELDTPYVHIVRMRRVGKRHAAFFGTTDRDPKTLVECLFNDSFEPSFSIVTSGNHGKGSGEVDFSDLISIPQSLTVEVQPTSSSARNVNILLFSPFNPAYTGPSDERPCAIINVHGGPTSVEFRGLNMVKQFFTTRGWAWIDVNYSGSSNFGRQYMDRLKGNWGVMDTEDCAYVVNELSSEKFGVIDRARVVIRGGSAGGFTTLSALIQPNPSLQVFSAGTSSFGISDLKVLAEITHKFQSWYVQSLLGGTYADKMEVYRSRSAVFHAEKIKVPLLIMQGSLDPIVPPSQAEAIVKAIRGQGGKVECTIFENESHGWRQAQTIKQALELEAFFYEKNFKFQRGE